MVDNLSAVNYSGYQNDLVVKNNSKNKYLASQLPEAKPDSVSFTGNNEAEAETEAQENDKKETKSKSHTTAYIIAGALVVGALLTGKYFNKIKGFFSSKGTKDAVTKGTEAIGEKAKDAAKSVQEGAEVVKDKLTRAKNRVAERISTGKKKVKGTSVNGASNPITPEQEYRVATNINTQHVNGNTRKAVQESTDKLVTPAQQAAYDANIAYQPLSAEQIAAKAKLDTKNAAQKADLNAIENNSKGSEKLKGARKKAKKAAHLASRIPDGGHVHPDNKNIYYTKNGEVTKIITPTPNSKGDYEILDPIKIAKHLAKHNVDITKFAAK